MSANGIICLVSRDGETKSSDDECNAAKKCAHEDGFRTQSTRTRSHGADARWKCRQICIFYSSRNNDVVILVDNWISRLGVISVKCKYLYVIWMQDNVHWVLLDAYAIETNAWRDCPILQIKSWNYHLRTFDGTCLCCMAINKHRITSQNLLHFHGKHASCSWHTMANCVSKQLKMFLHGTEHCLFANHKSVSSALHLSKLLLISFDSLERWKLLFIPCLSFFSLSVYLSLLLH